MTRSISHFIVMGQGLRQPDECLVDCLDTTALASIPLGHNSSWLLPVRDVFVNAFLSSGHTLTTAAGKRRLASRLSLRIRRCRAHFSILLSVRRLWLALVSKLRRLKENCDPLLLSYVFGMSVNRLSSVLMTVLLREGFLCTFLEPSPMCQSCGEKCGSAFYHLLSG